MRQTIAYLSQGTTLEPGSIIMTGMYIASSGRLIAHPVLGTPKGVGFVRNPPIVLKHGDDVRVWVGGGMDTLINTVVEEGKEKARL